MSSQLPTFSFTNATPSISGYQPSAPSQRRTSNSTAGGTSSVPLGDAAGPRRLTSSWRLDNSSCLTSSTITNSAIGKNCTSTGHLQTSPTLFTGSYSAAATSSQLQPVGKPQFAITASASLQGGNHDQDEERALVGVAKQFSLPSSACTKQPTLLSMSPRAQVMARAFADKLKMRTGVTNKQIGVGKTKSGEASAASGKGEGAAASTPAPPANVSRVANYRRSTTFHATDLERLRTRDDGVSATLGQNALKKHASMEDEVWDPYDNSDTDSDEKRETLAEILGDLEFERDQFDPREKLSRLLPTGNLNLVNTYDPVNSVVRLRHLHHSPKTDRRLRQKILAKLEKQWKQKQKLERRELLLRKRTAEQAKRTGERISVGPGGSSFRQSVQPASGTSPKGTSGPPGTNATTDPGTASADALNDDEDEIRRHPYLDPLPSLEEEAEAADENSGTSFKQGCTTSGSSANTLNKAATRKTELQMRIDAILSGKSSYPPGACGYNTHGTTASCSYNYSDANAGAAFRGSHRTRASVFTEGALLSLNRAGGQSSGGGGKPGWFRRPTRNHLYDHRHWWQNLPFDLLPKEYRRQEATRRRQLERSKIALDPVIFTKT
ncbi:unnamed protein product [Amoebophrya sp. A120]|nr:unnamed protein product [Amoebophrya sp. A120]|eukprot:GSA120T00018775001.1